MLALNPKPSPWRQFLDPLGGSCTQGLFSCTGCCALTVTTLAQMGWPLRSESGHEVLRAFVPCSTCGAGRFAVRSTRAAGTAAPQRRRPQSGEKDATGLVRSIGGEIPRLQTSDEVLAPFACLYRHERRRRRRAGGHAHLPRRCQRRSRAAGGRAPGPGHPRGPQAAAAAPLPPARRFLRRPHHPARGAEFLLDALISV